MFEFLWLNCVLHICQFHNDNKCHFKHKLYNIVLSRLVLYYQLCEFHHLYNSLLLRDEIYKHIHRVPNLYPNGFLQSILFLCILQEELNDQLFYFEVCNVKFLMEKS